jgi:hypothetical protein
MRRLSFLLFSIVASTNACGNSEGGTSVATGGNAGTGGGTGGSSAGSNSGGKGGSLATGGVAGTAGTGGSAAGAGGSAGAATQCPQNPPTDGSPCTQAGQSCYYQDCAGAGLSAAQCMGASWTVETSACASFACSGFGDECMAGQICSVQQGGAIFAECMDNPCGTGPVTCDCVSPGCGTCNVNAYTGSGITVTCNTCPQGGCP